MERAKESDLIFRFGDWGPKYLFRGPHWEGGLIEIPSGKKLELHYHEQVDEVFYVIEGKPVIYVDNTPHDLSPGDAVRVSAREKHTIENLHQEIVKIFFIKSPYLPKDRITLEEAR